MSVECHGLTLSVFKAILCGLEEIPGKNPSVLVGISSTPHKMAWNTLWAGTLEYNKVYSKVKGQTLHQGY